MSNEPVVPTPDEEPLPPPTEAPDQKDREDAVDADSRLEDTVDDKLPASLQMAKVAGQIILNMAEQLFVRSWEAKGGEMTFQERKRYIDLSIMAAREFKAQGDKELERLVVTYDTYLRKKFRGKDAPAGPSKLILPGAGMLAPHFQQGTLPGVNGPIRGR